MSNQWLPSIGSSLLTSSFTEHLPSVLLRAGIGLAERRQRPLIASINVVNRCNLHCAGCYWSRTERNEDREELCQDVFLKVYEKISEFNFQSKLSTWIATIAYRMGVNHLRKKKIELSDIPEEESFTAHFVSDNDPQENMEDNDIEAITLKLIDQLPPHYKTILTLYHVDQMNYGEIGEVTGMPEGTVKNYLFRARNLLKEKVKIMNIGVVE